MDDTPNTSTPSVGAYRGPVGGLAKASLSRPEDSRPPEVAIELSRLSELTSLLHDRIGGLHSKLSPILAERPVDPRNEKEPGRQTKIGGLIATEANKVSDAIAAIEHLIRSVEI